VNPLEGALLGLVQGLTEFLPVSSSGHLVLFGAWLDSEGGDGAALEALLHLGTLAAVVVFFRAELRALLPAVCSPARWVKPAPDDRDGQTLRFLALATAVKAAVAFPMRDRLEALFDSPRAVGYALFATTAVLLVSRWIRPVKGGPVPGWAALAVGAAQAAAVVPGVSRSGTTIVVAMLVGVPLARVGALSFLLAIPAIVAGAALELVRHPPPASAWAGAGLGMLVAALSGYLAMRWVLNWVARGRLHWFAPYTAAVGAAVLWLV